jgi:hypothetical protein
VYDSSNRPLADAWIYLQSSGTPDLDRYGQTDAQGKYRIDQVAAGSVAVGAQDGVTGLADNTSIMLADRQSVTLDLHLPVALGAVAGRVTAADGILAVPNAQVSLVMARVYGPAGTMWLGTTADGNGQFSFSPVPAGPFRLAAVDPDQERLLGSAVGTAAAGATSQVDLRLGGAQASDFSLLGADGYRYGINCSGNLESGGQPAQGQEEYFGDFLTLDVNATRFPCAPAVVSSDDLRELTYGPALFDSVRVSRRVYSPAAGGFLRVIDSFTNTGTQAVALAVRIGRYDIGRNMPLLVGPDGTAQAYAVLDRPPYAQVSGGAGVPAPARSFVYQPAGPENANTARLSYSRTLSIAPGATVSLMHFSVQAGDGASAIAAAQALSGGQAPSMFDKLSPQDKATIINFSVP